MSVVNMHDAKSQLSDLVARAEAGEEIIIARRNKPAVRLVVVGETLIGFGESEQVGYDTAGLNEAIRSGREFTIMQHGKAVAKVAPVATKRPRVPGALAHLASNIPDDRLFEPLSEDELQAWEGKYSFDPDA